MTTGVYLLPLVPSAFQFTPNSVVGGNSLTARLVMNGVASTEGKVVTIGDNSLFADTPSSLVIPSRAPQGTFQISTLPVTTTQYVTVTASVPQGTATAHFVIRPR